jgi:hypothetical protein
MRVSKGKVPTYSGTTLDFTTKGEVKVSMVDYLKGVINDFPEVVTGASATSTTGNLFDVRTNEEITVLDETRARSFHHSVAHILFTPSISRKDIQTTVDFLTTRVRSPDEDDWGKLEWVLKYIRETIQMPLILNADSMDIVKWWVDA